MADNYVTRIAYEQVAGWLRGLGATPDQVHRIVLRPGVIEVTRIRRDHTGHPFAVGEGNDRRTALITYDVRIMPPVESDEPKESDKPKESEWATRAAPGCAPWHIDQH